MNRSLIALALAALLPLSAQADDQLSYTYVEANYVNFESDADGFGVRGAFEFGESNFYGFGSYVMLEADDVNVDFNFADIGLGYAHSLSESTDLISEIAYVNADVDGADSANGHRVSVGVRGSITPKFEGLVKANYIDGSDFDAGFSTTIGAQYKFAQNWGVTGEIQVDDDARSYLVGLRASF